MVRSAIIDAFVGSWPIFTIVLVILASLRITDLIINKKKLILYKEFLILSFITYILCLFYVVSFDDVDWSTSNFKIFHEILRYDFGSRLFFKNVLSNMLMFVPYGFFAAYFLQAKSVKSIVILSTIISVTIESTQLFIGRVFDVDDIVLNILGGILGYIIYKVLINIKDKLPNILKKEWFYNFMSIILIIIIVMYVFNIFNLGGFPW